MYNHIWSVDNNLSITANTVAEMTPVKMAALGDEH